MNLLNLIPFGQANAITRRELCLLTGLTDREVRRQIQALRAGGEIIINNQDGRGYYRTDDPAEIERYYRQEYSRAVTIIKTVNAIKTKHMYLETAKVQMSM